MAQHGDIRERTSFLFFPSTIDGVRNFWTKETWTEKYVHNIHSYDGYWKGLHWGRKKDHYKFDELVMTFYT